MAESAREKTVVRTVVTGQKKSIQRKCPSGGEAAAAAVRGAAEAEGGGGSGVGK